MKSSSENGRLEKLRRLMEFAKAIRGNLLVNEVEDIAWRLVETTPARDLMLREILSAYKNDLNYDNLQKGIESSFAKMALRDNDLVPWLARVFSAVYSFNLAALVAEVVWVEERGYGDKCDESTEAVRAILVAALEKTADTSYRTEAWDLHQAVKRDEGSH